MNQAKILFVCRQNIGRSQMARALYAQLHPQAQADAAGTMVEAPGQTLAQAGAVKTIAVMQELGLDVSERTRRQITPAMLPNYDTIIVMSEPENTPDWLEHAPNAQRWDVPDTKDTDLAATRVVRDDIRSRVAKL